MICLQLLSNFCIQLSTHQSTTYSNPLTNPLIVPSSITNSLCLEYLYAVEEFSINRMPLNFFDILHIKIIVSERHGLFSCPTRHLNLAWPLLWFGVEVCYTCILLTPLDDSSQSQGGHLHNKVITFIFVNTTWILL